MVAQKAVDTTAIILAAGTSSRMGRINKLLSSWRGKSLLEIVVENILASDVHDVIVVTGFEHRKIEKILGDYPLRFVRNPNYAEGMTSSIQTGVGVVLNGGILICLGDMPKITSEEHNEMLPLSGDKIIRVPVFNGKRGNPVFFSHHFRTDLLEHQLTEG